MTDITNQISHILERSPDVWAVTITARESDRNKCLSLVITRTAQSGRISRPALTDVDVTVRVWERAPDIVHTIESDWITYDEVDKIVRGLARKYEASDIGRNYDEEVAETRWLFKPYKLWPADYKTRIV